MGMYYKAKLVVGLPYGELVFDLEDEDDLLDELDRASPYYDCDQDDMIFGVEIAATSDYSHQEFTYDQAKVDSAKLEFKELTGKEGRLFLSPHGY